MESIFDEDLITVAKQIGRIPRVFRTVKVRCPHGFPSVVECEPELDGSPFPTLYWLTCPFLRKRISHLEANGMIREIETMLRNDQELRRRYEIAHLVVIELRERLIRNRDIKEKLRQVGSGGIKDFATVKCLHVHVADYLSGVDNPVGQFVLTKIQEPYCSPGKILCK